MLNWVRDKLAEGRLRWQQSVQQQRDNTSPPPLPPPNVIDSSPASPSLTPIANSSRSIDSDDNDSSIQQCRTLAPGQCQNAHHMHNRSSDSIKPNGNIIKQHYSQISTRDQGYMSNLFTLLTMVFKSIFCFNFYGFNEIFDVSLSLHMLCVKH